MVIIDSDNNENNQNNQTSEQKLSDRVYPKGVKPELSPNPKFSGFTKQVKCLCGEGYETIHDFIDLSDTTYYDAEKGDWLRIEPNTLFVLEYPNGDKEYWTVVDPNLSQVEGEDATPTTPIENLIRVYPEYPSADAREVGETPTPVLVKGNNEPNLKENQPPRKRPRVFSEPVAFQDDVFVKGKLLGKPLYKHTITFNQGDSSIENANHKFYIINTNPNKMFNKIVLDESTVQALLSGDEITLVKREDIVLPYVVYDFENGENYFGADEIYLYASTGQDEYKETTYSIAVTYNAGTEYIIYEDRDERYAYGFFIEDIVTPL